MKRFILLLIIITIITLIAFVYFSSSILYHLNIDQFVKQAIEQQLGRSVQFDYMRIHIFPTISLKLKNFSISEKKYYAVEEILAVETVSLNLNIVPLLLKRIAVQKLILKNAQMHLVKRGEKLNINELLLDQAKQAAAQSKDDRGKLFNLNNKSKKETPDIDFIISDLDIKNASFHFSQLDQSGKTINTEVIDAIDGYFSDVSLTKPIAFKLRGIPQGGKQPVRINGLVALAMNDLVGNSSLAAKISTNQFALKHYIDTYLSSSTYQVDEGTLSCDLNITKGQDEKNIFLKGTVELNDFPIPSRKKEQKAEYIDSTFDIDIGCILPFEKVFINKLNAQFASTRLQFEGEVNVKDEDIKLRCFSLNTNVWDIPYVNGLLAERMPPEIIIQGDMAYDVVLSGDFFKQTIRGTVDLADNAITFQSIYKKPEKYPLLFDVNLRMEAFQSLAGDVNVSLGDLTVKGNIRDLDFLSKELECNFLSNKFSLVPLSEQLILFDDLEVDGGAKILFNTKGAFDKLERIKFNVGITLDDVTIKQNEFLLVRELNTFLTVNPNTIEMNEASGVVLDSLFNGWLQVKEYQKNPIINFDIYSSECDVDTFLNYFQTLEKKEEQAVPRAPADSYLPEDSAQSLPGKLSTISGEGAFFVNKLTYNDTDFQELKGVMQMKNGIMRLENIEVKGFSGLIKTSTGVDFTIEPLGYQSTYALEKLNVMDIFNFIQGTVGEEFIDGVVSSEGTIAGRGFASADMERYLQGKGTVHITDGQLKKIDILKAVSTVKQLLGLNEMSYGGTRFDDIHSTFVIEQGKITTDDVTLSSDDISVQGGGSLALKGDLDFNVNVMLSSQLSGKLFKTVNADEILSIPLRIGGTLEKPRYSITGGVVNRLVDNLIQQGLRSILKVEQSPQTAAPAEEGVITDTTPATAPRTPQQSSGPITDETTEATPTAAPPTREMTNDELLEDAIRTGLGLLLNRDE